MRHRLLIAMPRLFFLCVFLAMSFGSEIARAQTAPATAPMYLVCWSSKGGLQYFSGVSSVPAAGPTPAKMAFADFLKQKYAYEGFVTSSMFHTQAEAQAYLHQLVANAQGLGAAAKYTETGWVYTPPAGAAAPTAAPAATPPAGQVPRTAAVLAYTVCAASSPSKGAGYISAVFPVTNTDDAAWTNAFTQFLRQKYSVQDVNFLGCDSTTLENANSSKANRIAGWRNRIAVVETGWTYGFVPPAPAPRLATAPAAQTQAPAKPVAPSQPIPAAPAAVVSGPPSDYGVCIADNGGGVVYFSAPFKVSGRAIFRWEQAFGELLQRKYQYGGSVGCSSNGSLADAQSYIKKLDDALRPTKKIIDTGWTYQ